jgi:hypothetical protein
MKMENEIHLNSFSLVKVRIIRKTMNVSAPMFITMAKSNQSFFPESASNDVVIGVREEQQTILFGVADSPSVVRISNSNMLVNGPIQTDNMAVGGQIVGTGSQVLFSAIDPGWQVLNNDDSGIGIGVQRVQVNSGFLNWGNVCQVNIESGVFSASGSNDVLLGYPAITTTEQSYSKNNVSFDGKPLTGDIVIGNDNKTINIVGPGGAFSFGFHVLNTSAGGSFDENVVFRCYYRKSSTMSTFANYYLLKGTQWITTSLPSYGGLRIVYDPADNGNAPLELTSGTIFMINRLSVTETL